MKILLAALALAALVQAGSAHADTAESWGRANESVTCTVFKDHPSAAGLVGIMEAIETETGFTNHQAAQALTAGILDGCPKMWPVLTAILHLNDDTTGSLA